MCITVHLLSIVRPHGVPKKPSTLLRQNRENPGFLVLTVLTHTIPFDPPKEYLRQFNPDDMPLPSVHTEEADAKTTFQKLDRIWAHNTSGRISG